MEYGPGREMFCRRPAEDNRDRVRSAGQFQDNAGGGQARVTWGEVIDSLTPKKISQREDDERTNAAINGRRFRETELGVWSVRAKGSASVSQGSAVAIVEEQKNMR